MVKIKMTPEDQKVINDFNTKFQAGLDALDKAKQLKVSDYLVLYVQDRKTGHMALQTNSYGAPVKYMVVYCTSNGIPFVKKVSKKGVPTGRLYSVTGHLDSDTYAKYGQKFQFEMDPDYADSLLLQDSYDPAQLHKSKKDIWKAVTEHNKTCKIPTHDLNAVAAFLGTVTVGDTLWRSNISHFLVQDKVTLSRNEYSQKYQPNKNYKMFTKVKGPYIVVLTVIDKKGIVFDVTADFFLHKALYKERPRTYKELNI